MQCESVVRQCGLMVRLNTASLWSWYELCWKSQPWTYEGFGVSHSSSLDTYIESLSVFFLEENITEREECQVLSWQILTQEKKSFYFPSLFSGYGARTWGQGDVHTSFLTLTPVMHRRCSISPSLLREMASPMLQSSKGRVRGRPSSDWPQSLCFHCLPTFH